MSFRRLHAEQPESFAFTPENLAWAKEVIARYPEGRQASAVIPLLWRAQEQNGGWVTEPMIRTIAEMLGMKPIRVLEIATFYTMFQLRPVGRKAHIQVCGTTPCMLRGAEELIKVCRKRIAEKAHELSPDGDFSWEEVECLGACANAPMVQIGETVYEDLTPERLEAIIDEIAAGRMPKGGPQNGRTSSEPLGGPTTLSDPSLYEKGSDAAALIEARRKTAAAGGSATAAADGEDDSEATKAGRGGEAAGDLSGDAGSDDSGAGVAAAAMAPATAEARTAGAGADDVTAPGKTGDEAIGAEPDGDEGAMTERGGAAADEAVADAGVQALAEMDEAALAEVEEKPPVTYDSPPEKIDDLKMISGIGPKIEKILHDLGIYTFEQIAAWGPAEIKWVDQRLKFKGRIIREKWVAQADALARGGRDEYVRRFGKEPR